MNNVPHFLPAKSKGGQIDDADGWILIKSSVLSGHTICIGQEICEENLRLMERSIKLGNDGYDTTQKDRTKQLRKLSEGKLSEQIKRRPQGIPLSHDRCLAKLCERQTKTFFIPGFIFTYQRRKHTNHDVMPARGLSVEAKTLLAEQSVVSTTQAPFRKVFEMIKRKNDVDRAKFTDSSITGVQLAKKLKNHHYRYLNKFGPSHP
jgi:hypothetical protein